MRKPVVPEISPVELQKAMNGENPPFLLDVREAEERDIAVLADNLHIPLMQLAERANECEKALGAQQDLIVYCRSGARSAFAVEFLQEFGLKQAKNLRGGILAWASDIDRSLTTY